MNTDDSIGTLSDTAMVLAAGHGMRMRPLTLHRPKPLLEVGGRTMLDRALDKLVEMGIRRAVVNAHYLGDQIVDHLAQRKEPAIILSRETELLDTGGGIKNALGAFGGKPFFALNADLPWMDSSIPALERMASSWDATRMDALLLLMPRESAPGFTGHGDFNLMDDGRIRRRQCAPPLSHVWISAQIVKPSLYETVHERCFSNNVIFDKAEANRRLFGIEHNGTCFHVGTPQDLAEANRLLASGQGWAKAVAS